MNAAHQPMTGGDRVGVLLAAGPASWEPAAVQALGAARRQVALVRRCLDVTDLLAAAASGSADVAVVSDRLPGLDADSVARLARGGIRTVAVVASQPHGTTEALAAVRSRLSRIGVARVVDETAVPALADHVAATAALELTGTVDALPAEPSTPADDLRDPIADLLGDALDDAVDAGVDGGVDAGVDGVVVQPPGRLVAVWGPHGGPGRTTVSVGLAAEAAARGVGTLLLDADPYGGAVAQHLAVLDEVSGLLAAVRLANAGELRPASLAATARGVAPGLRVLTGLPRPHRWREVRPQPFEELLDVARSLDPLVVVDAGPGLPDDVVDPFPGGHRRDDVSVAAVAAADDVVLVGSADPVGLTSMTRALPELVELRGGEGLHVVVNRMRSSLGWSPDQVRDLVAGVAPTASVTFLPDDRSGADRALVNGRPLVASGDSALRRGVAALADELLGTETPGRRRRIARRRARHLAAQTVSSR